MADEIRDDMLNAALAHLARTWRAEAVKADVLSEKRPHPADVMLSTRAQCYSDCASALEAAISPPAPPDERDALAVAQERSLAVLSSLAAAIGKGNVALARMIADDDLVRVLDELSLAADAEIDARLHVRSDSDAAH